MINFADESRIAFPFNDYLMKIVRISIMLLALALVVYNATKLDFDQPLEGDSKIAVIGILAASCAFLMVWILNASLKIKRKSRRG